MLYVDKYRPKTLAETDYHKLLSNRLEKLVSPSLDLPLTPPGCL